MNVLEIYKGSNGDSTKALYGELEKRGAIGAVALNLFRACKCSERAKLYRGGIRGKGSFKSMAYDRKAWSMSLLCAILAAHGEELGITWGWKDDPNTVFGNESSWVLYVDSPHGQCSFHSPSRGNGPDYQGEWDGQRCMTTQRVIDFATALLKAEVAA